MKKIFKYTKIVYFLLIIITIIIIVIVVIILSFFDWLTAFIGPFLLSFDLYIYIYIYMHTLNSLEYNMDQ
jgi:hypothetical protein